MELARTICGIFFPVVWTALMFYMAYILEHSEKRENSIRVKAKVDATSRSTDAWLGMLDVYQDKIDKLEAENANLKSALDSCEKEIIRWESIAKKIKFSKEGINKDA